MRTIAEISLKKRDQHALEEAVQLLRSKFPIDRVILYGSKVSGTDTPESDLDLLLLTKASVTWQERDAITEALFDIELAYDVVISTLVVPKSEWISGRYSVLPIHDEIERWGVVA